MGAATITAAHGNTARALAAMAGLAALDLVGALLARHWAEHRSAVALVGGIVVFGLLFVAYGKSLDYAQLTTVTIGWFVLLQLGVMIVDGLQAGVRPPWDRLAAMVAVLALQGYLTATG